jgi:selenide,water dikinase
LLGGLYEPHPNVLVGSEGSEDASVYKLDDKRALVQTADFITPVVNDPYLYGQIAAANALSDVFAMGGEVLTALNLVGFDGCHHPYELLREILEGGRDKVLECGGVVTGGHTIDTPEMYYGLSVTGEVNPNSFWRNNTPRVGDVLLLTKPLGMGVLSTSIKADMLSKSEILEAAKIMAQLNVHAMRVLRDYQVSACTDVTGFGLLGHALEMANEKVTLTFNEGSIPFLQSAKMYADMGIIPAGTYANKTHVSFTCKEYENILLYDAQTSGGLLAALPEDEAKLALPKLHDIGYEHACIIGQVQELENEPIRVV